MIFEMTNKVPKVQKQFSKIEQKIAMWITVLSKADEDGSYIQNAEECSRKQREKCRIRLKSLKQNSKINYNTLESCETLYASNHLAWALHFSKWIFTRSLEQCHFVSKVQFCPNFWNSKIWGYRWYIWIPMMLWVIKEQRLWHFFTGSH